jgi:hypothetical protein
MSASNTCQPALLVGAATIETGVPLVKKNYCDKASILLSDILCAA